jgi:uncharacterized membrane protein
MKARALTTWERARSSFWFLPSLMALGAVAAATGFVTLDRSPAGRRWSTWWWAYSGSPEGATALLETVAGSMITIAGVVFSLTLVALTLASNQFGPRLLRNFMRDTANQVVIGTFVATFLYCLLVLRTIRREPEGSFVPHLSITLAVALALASVGVLIYFIHHVSVSIQANEVIDRVSRELMQGIEQIFPEPIGHDPGLRRDRAAEVPGDLDREARQVAAEDDGYLQRIDDGVLMGIAAGAGAIVRVERRPGQYIARGTPLVSVWPGGRATPEMEGRIRKTFVLGPQRTPAQDVEFSVQQLVEIAVRALSPGVNNPFTAVTCVDRLGSALCRLAGRAVPSSVRLDEGGHLRVIARPLTFPEVLDAAFLQIRRHARTEPSVTIRMLEAIGVVAQAVRRPEDRAALHRHADLISRGGRALPEEEDRRAVEERYREISRILRVAGMTAG